jgi:hypothetical protein
VATIGFALAAGFDLVVSVLLVIGLASGPPAAAWSDILTMLGVFASMGVMSLTGLLANFRWRAVWTKFPRKRQWSISWVAFGCVGIGHALVGWTLAACYM